MPFSDFFVKLFVIFFKSSEFLKFRVKALLLRVVADWYLPLVHVFVKFP